MASKLLAIEHLRTQTPSETGPLMIPHMKNQRFFLRVPQFAPSPLVPMRSSYGGWGGLVWAVWYGVLEHAEKFEDKMA